MGRYDGTIDAAPVCVSLQFCFCLASVLQYLFADPYLQEQSNKAFYQPFWEEQAIPMCTCVISSSILHRVLAHFGKWKCGWCILLSHSCMNKLSLCNCFSNGSAFTLSLQEASQKAAQRLSIYMPFRKASFSIAWACCWSPAMPVAFTQTINVN